MVSKLREALFQFCSIGCFLWADALSAVVIVVVIDFVVRSDRFDPSFFFFTVVHGWLMENTGQSIKNAKSV
ncbi:MAG TPA: hypothetical protein PKX17_06760 [Candidatus Methanomethylicus sp.]|nr:hypothetical protein [Candidatus Methanomethylicus sp.]